MARGGRGGCNTAERGGGEKGHGSTGLWLDVGRVRASLFLVGAGDRFLGDLRADWVPVVIHPAMLTAPKRAASGCKRRRQQQPRIGCGRQGAGGPGWGRG
jgi:hypothetical protein